MNNSIAALMVLMTGLCLFNACNDPTVIGSDLLGEDQVELNFTDTVTIKGKTIRDADSILTYSPSFRLQGHLLGIMEDSVFGRSEASIYAQARLRFDLIPKFAQVQNPSLDSMVLVLPWHPEGVYGDTLENTYGVEVYELLESLDEDEEYYSDRTFLTGDQPIGVLDNFLARPNTLTPVGTPHIDSVQMDTLAPHLRIRLDQLWATGNFFPNNDEDTLNFQNDTSFLEFFKGFHLKPSTINTGMLSFEFDDPIAGLYVYYQTEDGPAQYQFHIGRELDEVRMNRFDHNYENSVVDTYLNNPTEDDSILFVQAMAGVSTVLEFPFVESLGNIVVNKAELEIPIFWLPGDLDLAPIEQLSAEEIMDDGSTRQINDLDIALRSGGIFSLIFGGQVVNDEKYIMNISSQFQDMVTGSASNKVKITVLGKQERASRTVLKGPSSNNQSSRIKLNLSFTRLD